MGNIHTFNAGEFDNMEKTVATRKVRNPYVSTNTSSTQVEQEESVIINKQITFAKDWMNDEEWIGDKIQHKEKGDTRIWLQNPNGVSAAKDFRIFRSELEDVNDNEIDFLALPESTLNSNNHYVQSRLKMLVEYHCPGAKLCITNTRKYDEDACYQPGGVMTMAMGKLSGRYSGSGNDDLGRYSWTKFCGKQRTIKIYTFYRVSQTSGEKIGDSTAYVQQYNELNKHFRENDNENAKRRKLVKPREHVVQSLLRDINKDIENGVLVIVLGDLNECVMSSKFSKSMDEIGMTNVLQDKIIEKAKWRTQDRGKNIIDGIWMSYTLLPCVRRLGVAPFSKMFTSDHRGMYMDLKLRHILDTPDIEFRQVHMRKLQVSIPRRTNEYIKKILEKWNQHKLEDKIRMLMETQNNMTNEELEHVLNCLDTQIGEILTYAEKKCTSVNKNAIHEWSPKLGALIKEERQCRKRIRRLKRSPLNGNFENLTVEIKKEESTLKILVKEMREVKKNDAAYRKAHIDELIQERIDRDPRSTYAGELKKLQHIEEQRKEARRIKNTHGVIQKQGITKVLIPADSEYDLIDGNRSDMYNMDVMWERLKIKNGKDIQKWIQVEDRQILERLTLQCMKKHFGQAEGTPLTTNSWSSQLMNEDFIENIKNENYEDLNDENREIQEYFKAMAQPKRVKEMSQFEYSFEEWKNHIKKVKEKTTTSPSGRHYGHWKLLLEKAPKIFRNIYDIMNLSLRRSILLKRWKVTVTVLIPKDPGTPKIHRLRPLHIVEPEINAIAKALWARKLMKKAERTGNMSDDQYGGRKNRQAQSAVLNKILYYDINRMRAQEAQYDDIDMKSNYDRELVRLVAAEARIKLGMHAKDATFMVNFVESQEFHVKTAYGISEEKYCYSPDCKLYGLGQGIAWSGPGWLLASDTIAKCKLKTCIGMEYESPITSLKVKKNQDKFVDDTGCGCNQKTISKTIMQQAQLNCQYHSKYVETTGGMIAADKSHFYHIDWEFKDGILVPKEPHPDDMIRLKQIDGFSRNFRKMQNDEEHKTLGCWVNPIGNNTKAFHQMATFMRNWVNRMKHSRLPAKLIRKSYDSELKSQLRYRLPIYMFTSQQCDELMKIINPTLLHANYMNRNYPRSLLQAGEQYGGMNLTHIYDLMGMEKTKFLLMHLRRQDTTAKLLEIEFQNIQLECGSETLFFNLEYEKFSQLVTDSWSKHLWKYYDDRAIEMDLDLEITQTKQRKNDRFIMDILVNSGELLEKELFGINKYRQYLEVIMLSDIVDFRGRRILQDMKGGINRRKSKFKFAKQEPINLWAKWWTSKACPILEKNLGKNHLGGWIAMTHQTWEWEYGTHDGRHYLKSNDKVYQRIGNRYVWQQSPNQDENYIFDQWADVSTDKHMNPYTIAKTLKSDMVEEQSQDVRTKSEEETRKLHRKNWGNVEFLESRKVLAEAILDDDCVVATDGSNKNSEGAQAWLMANRAGKVLVRGRGRVPCAKQDSSSLRPELAALLAVTTFMDDFVQQEKIEHERRQEITVYTDSANAISDMKSGMYPSTKNVLENNIDMKLELKRILRTSKQKYHLQHVKAHQDKHMEVEDLPFEAKLNKLVDEYAGGVYEDIACGEYEDMVPFYNAQVCSLKLPFGRPVSNVCEQLIAFANGHLSEAQLARFWKIEEKWLCNIEWEAFKVAVRRTRNATKRRLCKIVHKQIPTMKMLKRNGMSLTSLCPLCKDKDEDWNHVFQCKSVIAKTAREEHLDDLKKVLQCRKTHPVVLKRIMALLYQWTNQYKITVPSGDGNFELINKAFADQCNLGVSNMMAGVLTHKFGNIQQSYYSQVEEKGVRFTKREWNVNVIRALLQYSEAIWKARCTYVHEESQLTMETQTKMLAMRIRSNLLQNPWKLRQEDKELMARNIKFFHRAGAKQLNRWMERVLVSMSIAQNQENSTRQDIRKWMHMPDGGYIKRIKHPMKAISKKYIQLTLRECIHDPLKEQHQRHIEDEDVDYDQDEEECVKVLESSAMETGTEIDQMNYEVEEACSFGTGEQDPSEMQSLNKMIHPIASWFQRRLGVWKEVTKNENEDDDTEEIIYPEEIIPWHNDESVQPKLNMRMLPDDPKSPTQSQTNITMCMPVEEERYEDIACCADGSGASSILSKEFSNMSFNEYVGMRTKGRNRRMYALINSATQEALSFITPVVNFCRWNRNVRSYSDREEGKTSPDVEKSSAKRGQRSMRVRDILREIDSCSSISSDSEIGEMCELEEIDSMCHERDEMCVIERQSTTTSFIETMSGLTLSDPANNLMERRGLIKLFEKHEESEEKNNETNWMRKENKQTYGIPKEIKVQLGPHAIQRSIIRTRQKEEVETFRGSSGSRVVKNANGFFHQVRVVDEADLQQCANMHDEKKRNRDPSTSCKQLQHISNALSQVKSQQQRSQRILNTEANNLNSTINAMKQQECDSNNNVESQSMRQNLSFHSKQSRSNVMLNHKSYLRKARARMSIHRQDMNRRHVICAQSFMKFSLSEERGKLTNELRMTSVEKEKNCRVTGLKDGTEIENGKFIKGKNEVDPSTYPTGCPNNYFDCLNKNNTKS